MIDLLDGFDILLLKLLIYKPIQQILIEPSVVNKVLYNVFLEATLLCYKKKNITFESFKELILNSLAKYDSLVSSIDVINQNINIPRVKFTSKDILGINEKNQYVLLINSLALPPGFVRVINSFLYIEKDELINTSLIEANKEFELNIQSLESENIIQILSSLLCIAFSRSFRFPSTLKTDNVKTLINLDLIIKNDHPCISPFEMPKLDNLKEIICAVYELDGELIFELYKYLFSINSKASIIFIGQREVLNLYFNTSISKNVEGGYLINGYVKKHNGVRSKLVITPIIN